jgi:hypothetical protein
LIVIRLKLIACDPDSRRIALGGNMASYTTGNRLGRPAALALFLSALAGQFALAQPELFSGPRNKYGAVISDYDEFYDGGAPSYGCASCDGGGQCGDPDCGCDCGAYDGSCCGHDSGCRAQNLSFWFGAEWLRWQLDGNRLPPLVTDGPVTDPSADVARLDNPNTRILSGDATVNDDWRSGFRVFGGVWLNCCRTWGVEADYFDIGDDDYTFQSVPGFNRVVGRPFFNSELGEDDVEFVSISDELDGSVRVNSSDEFKGAGAAFVHCLWNCSNPCSCSGRELECLAGYRYYEYDSHLSITENLEVLPGTQTPLVPGTTFFIQDQFRTHNEFHGGEIGLRGMSQHREFWIDGMAKLAIGSHQRTVIVDGETIIVVPGGGTSDQAGGLLTSEVTNIGRYEDSQFVVIPEFRLGLGARVNDYCAVRVGYNVILWNDVARAASHLPPGLAVDPRNLPPVQAGGGPEPEFPGITGSNLVAHGFDLGVVFEF